MKLIIGLGNPGEKYEKTRHSLGFMVIDELLRKITPIEETVWEKDSQSGSLVVKVKSLLLVKPQTMMNASGFSVAKLANFYKIKPEDIWVIHDDVDLTLGKMKIRLGGAGAGHHGVESVIKNLGTDKFVRFRLGISHPRRGIDGLVERYVLRKFDINEKTEIKQVIKKAVKAIQISLKDGLETAMNRFNN